MDVQKIKEVLAVYRQYFESLGIEKKTFSYNKKPESSEQIFSHCYGMLDKIEEFIAKGRTGKAFRWLGFIQGCLWSVGNYTLKELRKHIRSE